MTDLCILTCDTLALLNLSFLIWSSSSSRCLVRGVWCSRGVDCDFSDIKEVFNGCEDTVFNVGSLKAEADLFGESAAYEKSENLLDPPFSFKSF